MTRTPDLTDPASRRDPFPVYRWLRVHDPVHWSERLKMWVVTRYDDVQHVLLDPARFSSDRFRKMDAEFVHRRPDAEDVAAILRDWAVYRDPPNHTRLRGLLNRAFTPRTIELMQPRIRRIVEELLDVMAGSSTPDFIREFAFPLPATVIGGLLGVPAEDLAQIKVWSDQIAAYIGGAQRGRDNIEDARRGLLATCDYFAELIARRRIEGGDDLISLMLAAEDRGDMLSDHEVAANCVLLLFAGHETTTNLLGNGLYHLLERPQQYRLLRDHPELGASAAEEFLRYDPPVSGTIKIVTEPVELRGRRLTAGDMIAAQIAAGNRDPSVFDDPEALRVDRSGPKHLTFGVGIHFCLGAALARMECQIAFAALLRRLPELRLAAEAEPEWKPQLFFRGLARLPIAWG
jgi:cytochrome P450